MGWACTRIRAQPVQAARQAAVSRKKLSGLPTGPCVFYSHLHLPSILTMLAHLNLSWGPDTHQTLSSPPRGVKTGSRAEVRAHFPAGLLKAPAPLPQVFLTLPWTFAASAKSVYAAPSHLCSPPILPPSSPPPPPPPHCARHRQEPLLPATKALTAPPKDFQENLPTDSKGGHELRASHSNVPPEFILLRIPLTNFVICGQYLDPFEPQFAPL